jgi:endonuclease/exonuclease/phosphatase family metal-dependent hydrolase
VALALVTAALLIPRNVQGDDRLAATARPEVCAARAALSGPYTITWHAAAADDLVTLDRWCRAVGPPIVRPVPSHQIAGPPALDTLIVLTWNAHLGEGRLAELISTLRQGDLTGGRPVQHFVLLVQELHRRGDEVPAFTPGARSAFAITPRNPKVFDASDYAQQLGLSMVYVPSMRNGAQMLEDRGSAIISTERLVDIIALELPFERQRRVAVGAAVAVSTPDGVAHLNLLNVHLEPLSSPATLWLFRNPRQRQIAAILDLLATGQFASRSGSAGTVLGGDFNTIRGGAEEATYRVARSWSRSLVDEDARRTHWLGRLDYLFFRLSPGWHAETVRLDNRFGSDHHPVLGRFRPAAE